jgi:hypothetical protein
MGKDVNNFYDTRASLERFLSHQIPLIISRIVNDYKPPEDKVGVFESLLQSLQLSQKHKIQLSKIRDKCKAPFIFANDDLEYVIKNISIISFTVINILIDILSIDGKVTASIANFILYSLIERVKNNDSNLDLLRKTIDELRERRKQDLMEAYAADDEVRQLQMLLKKIGIQDWKDTGVEKQEGQQDEDESLQLTGFQGENDDNVENDDDYGLTYDHVSS